jgi:hypothetical protein
MVEKPARRLSGLLLLLLLLMATKVKMQNQSQPASQPATKIFHSKQS